MSSHLRLAAPPRVIARLAPALVAASGAWPPVTLVERDGDLAPALLDGAADVAVGEVADDPALTREPVADEPLVLLAPSPGPLARSGAAPPAERLARLPLVGLARGAPVQELVERWLDGEGAPRPRFVVRCDADVSLPALVAAGLGLAICPALAVPPGDRGVVALDLPAPALALALATRLAETAPPAVRTATATALAFTPRPPR